VGAAQVSSAVFVHNLQAVDIDPMNADQTPFTQPGAGSTDGANREPKGCRG
jgi:hypothetical protein